MNKTNLKKHTKKRQNKLIYTNKLIRIKETL
jgi:hypothetical protein